MYASPGSVPRGTSGLRPSRVVGPHEKRAPSVFHVKRELHEPAAVHLRSGFHVEHGCRSPCRILTPPIGMFHVERDNCGPRSRHPSTFHVKRIAGEFLGVRRSSTGNTAARSDCIPAIPLMFHVEPSRTRMREPRVNLGRPAQPPTVCSLPTEIVATIAEFERAPAIAIRAGP